MHPVPPNCVKNSIEQFESSDRELISSGSTPNDIINMGSQISKKKNACGNGVLPSEDENFSRLCRKSVRERLSLNDCCLSPRKEKIMNRNLPTKKNSFRRMASSKIAKIGEKSDELIEQSKMKNSDESGNRDSGYKRIPSGNNLSWSSFPTATNSSFRRSPSEDERRIKGGNPDNGHERISSGDNLSCPSSPTADSSFRRLPGVERLRKDSTQTFKKEHAARKSFKESLSFSSVNSGKLTKYSSSLNLSMDTYKPETPLAKEKSEKDIDMEAEPNSYKREHNTFKRQLLTPPTPSKPTIYFGFLFSEKKISSSSEIPSKDQQHMQDSLKLSEVLLKSTPRRKSSNSTAIERKAKTRHYQRRKLERIAEDIILDLSALDFTLKSTPRQKKRARYQVIQFSKKRGIPFFSPDLETILEETEDSESDDDEGFEILNASSIASNQ